MKILKRVIPAAVLASAALAFPAAGAAATAAVPGAVLPAAGDNRNAALYYWRALYALDRDFQKEAADYLVQDRTADWVPSPAAIAKLKNSGSFIRQLLQATEIDKCDFGIAYDEGYLALLPHLGPLRAGARILVLDAHRLMSEGRPDDAAERIAGIYRMAVHLRNDNVLISSLVGIAMASLAADEAEMFAKAGKLTDNGRSVIFAAMQPLNQVDGYGVKRCIEMERHMTIDYLRRTLKGEEAGKKLLDIGLFEIEASLKERIGALNEAAVSKSLDEMEVSYKDILSAWNAPNAEKELGNVAAKLERGDYGLLAQVLTPALSKAKSSDVKAKQRIDEVIETLATMRAFTPETNAQAAPAGATSK